MTERLFVRLEGDALYAPETGTPAGTMRELPLGPFLARHTRSLLAYRETFAPGVEVVERVLPDGALRLIVRVNDEARSASVTVAGASAAPALVRLSGREHGVSMALLPGTAAMLGLAAGALTEQAVDARELWGRAGAELTERLAEASSDEHRARILDAMLAAQAPSEDLQNVRSARRAARWIHESQGRRPLKEIAGELGVGERRLQQLFHAHVGLTPRALGRLARMHGCLRALRTSPTPRWSHLAADGGFYDQSHLVNEFKALCGLTPSAFLAASGSSKPSAPADATS